jgi:gliding motility-associated peptidyl-prolyl isomerase
MNYFKKIFYTLIFSCLLASCQQQQEARRPLSQASGSFMKKSIDRNKKLVASEEDVIKRIIKANPKTKYYATRKGYWFYYEEQNLNDTSTPKKGDIAYFTLEIKNIDGKVIYPEEELGPQTYVVDKQEIMMGLRDGIKLMHKNETVTFLFPSHIAYGYHGDDKKIGTNQSLICTVTLRNFAPDPAVSQPALALPPVAPVKTAAEPAQKANVVKEAVATKKDTLNP